ncbi:MAG: MBL fold metallo-hydrolase [Sulfurovum sp.]|nr:MBL fold metallo-hydrolase [Sulfurovum sp.]
MLNRRTFIGVCLGFSLLDAKTFKPWHLGHHGDFSFKQMAKSVYIMHGAKTRDNDAQCFIHNPAFIESKNGIIIIDSGASYIVGKAVLNQIRQISTKPILAIFNTHHHSDHWFANGAIVEAYPNVKIYGHRNIIDSATNMYLQGQERVTNQYKAKTFHLPSYFVEDGDKIEIDGEYFSIQHPKSAHSNSDITITHQKSNVIFLGDIVLESTLGYFSEISSILENIVFLEKLTKQPRYTLYVVGHGTSGDYKKTVAPYLYYLSSIKEEVSKAYKEDKGIFELQEAYANLKEKFTWKEDFYFPLTFLKNHMEFVYAELENKDNSF